jgi:hypothetical protein
MSGKPHREGVDAIRAKLAEIVAAEARAAVIRAQISEADRLTERATVLRREVIALMERMDVKSDGNFGWERRVIWFLAALTNGYEAV